MKGNQVANGCNATWNSAVDPYIPIAREVLFQNRTCQFRQFIHSACAPPWHFARRLHTRLILSWSLCRLYVDDGDAACGNSAMIPPTCFIRRHVLLVLAVALATIVNASHLHQRQNPGFITNLPTLSPSSVVVITTTVSPTNFATPQPTQVTGSLNAPVRPTPPPPLPTSAETTTLVNAVQGPYFGGIPGPSIDIPVTSVFLILFLLGGLTNAFFYRRNLNRSKRAPKDVVSGLVMLFCLSRVVSCTLRNVWAVTSTTTVAIFLALVSDNAG